MVFFICSHCGASLKKNKVEKHYAVQCRNAPLVSCMDCHKEFRDNDYVTHTKCITEDEKYSAKGFVPKPNSNKGECKQQEWLEVVRGVQSQEKLPKCLKTVLDSIVKFENIPRKKPKFLNFLKSNHIKISPQDLDQLWELLEKEHKRVKENVETSTTTNKVAETKEENSPADVNDSPKQNGDLSVEVVEECEATPKDKTKKRKRKSKDEVVDANEKEAEESTQATKKHNETPMDVDQEYEGTTKSSKKKKNKTETIGSSETQENENLQAAGELNKSDVIDVTCEVTPKEKTKKKKNKKENKTDTVDDIDMHGSENIQTTEKQNETTPVEVGEESRITPKKKTKDVKKETETEVVEDGESQMPEGQKEEVILTKKQKKEKKKREKYEAELKEIENSQFNNQPLEDDDDDGQNRKKKKSKKDKDINGLESNENSGTGVQAEETSIKPKKKRHLDDDQSAEPLKKKKKKEQGDELLEEICAVESSTAESATTENTNGLQKFKWNEVILEVLRSKGGEIPVKRLRKKVVAEYQNCCGSVESEDKVIVKFNKKLSKVPGVVIHKEVVKLAE